MSFWELVIFVLGLACPRTGILPFFDKHDKISIIKTLFS